MKKRVVMIMANGFEEIEAIATADVMKRLGLDVKLAGMDGRKVTGAHDIVIEADCLLSEVNTDVDAVILPGGMPGATNLRDNINVIEFISEAYEKGKVVGAICAAPIALAKAGILDGKRATCYPSFESQFANSTAYTASRLEVDGKVITARGAGVSFEFGAAIGKALGASDSDVVQLFAGMFVVS